MALDQNAGKKRAVGIARNLLMNEVSPSQTVAEALAPIQAASAEQAASSASPSVKAIQSNKVEAGATKAGEASFAKSQSGRTRKLSFLATSELENRFKKARLKGGFETIEDAYNEALIQFCELVESGRISRF